MKFWAMPSWNGDFRLIAGDAPGTSKLLLMQPTPHEMQLLGAFMTSAFYCLWLGRRNRTLGEYTSGATPLAANWTLAALSGLLWYCQFFFYGLGHTRMGPYGFSSWALHMILLVAFSNVLGLVLYEWRGCRPRTLRVLAVALVVLVAAVLTIAYGNNLGSAAS